MIPPSFEAFAFDTLAGLAPFLFEQIERNMAKYREILCRIPGANTAQVLMKHHI
jgi:hypothetical protein